MPGNNELSERELEILRLVATGASNKEIASQLSISTNTVKVHLRNVFAKIEVTSRTEAALYALHNGLVKQVAVVEDEDGLTGQSLERDGTEEEPAVALEPVVQAPVPPSARPAGWRNSVVLIAMAALIVFGLLGAIYVFRRPASPTASAATPTPAPRWKDLSEMPTPRLGLALAAYEAHLYAIGGKTAEGVTGVVEQYDPETDQWKARSEKPMPVQNVGAAVIGGKIFVPGGQLANGEPTDLLEIYDPRTDEWIEGAPLPAARSAYALAAFEGRLFLFGGWDGQKYVDTVYEYDPTRLEWIEKTSMPTARGFAGAAEASGYIYVVGGTDGNQALTVNEIYQPAQDQPGENPWESGTSLPEGRYGMGIAAVADILHLVGGQNDREGPLPSLQYQPQQGAWTEFELPASESWTQPGFAPLGPRLFLLGGQKQGVPTASSRVYQAIYTVVFPIIE